MAQLPPVVEKLEDVAEPARQFYVQKDGKFHVDLAGAPAGFTPAADLAAANAKVIEFRDTNIGLKKTLDELLPLKEQTKDLDITAARNAITELAELKKKGITKPDDIATMRANIVEDLQKTMLKPLQDQLAAITTTAQEDKKRADALTLRSTLGDMFTKAGGVAEATDFIVNKSAGVFKVVDGKVVAEANAFSVDRPGEPLTIGEWMTRMTKENAFAFKPSSGSGADPAKGAATSRPGVLTLTDPSPQDLGKYGKDIRDGKVRVAYSKK